MTQTLLSLGHGYCADALTTQLVPQGWQIIGTTRNPDKAEVLGATGIQALLWDDLEAVRDAVSKATHILISASPDAEGDPSLRAIGDAITARAESFDWVGYLSTTGVYGDHAGGWVDESTPLTASTKRGQARIHAEAEWQAIAGLPLHIFRLAGIYGPGRGPFSKVRNGTARRIIKEDQVFSRIHVDDIAQILEASMGQPKPGAVYNLCDDDPAPPQDVIAYAADLLGVPRPPEIAFAEADLSPMARSFYAESKRTRNDRIKDELGVSLIYPNYRDGLKALLMLEDSGDA